MSPSYIQNYFNDNLRKIICKSSSPQRIRLSPERIKARIPQTKKTIVIDKFKRKKNNYKTILKIISVTGRTSCVLTKNMLDDIMSNWNKENLKRIYCLQKYINLRGENQLVVRIQFHRGKLVDTNLLSEEHKEALKKLNELLKIHCKIRIMEMKAELFLSDSECWFYDAFNIMYKIGRAHV